MQQILFLHPFFIFILAVYLFAQQIIYYVQLSINTLSYFHDSYVIQRFEFKFLDFHCILYIDCLYTDYNIL
jgi:hypothetical protein